MRCLRNAQRCPILEALLCFGEYTASALHLMIVRRPRYGEGLGRDWRRQRAATSRGNAVQRVQAVESFELSGLARLLHH